jgi:hypothetical protein
MLTCFVLELDYNTDGTKDLFSDYLHIRLRISEDRGLDKEALVAEALASQMDCRTLLLPGVDIAHDALEKKTID